ncbi:hypothetical protein DL765_007749 [Monosporascus sp. GIB2]|nr:hypothetical protein DL765_007749 [Monosporascus sp. GIB2]
MTALTVARALTAPRAATMSMIHRTAGNAATRILVAVDEAVTRATKAKTSSGGFVDERRANSAYGGGYGGDRRGNDSYDSDRRQLTPGTAEIVPLTETTDQVIPPARVMEEVVLAMITDMALADEMVVRVTATARPRTYSSSGDRRDNDSYGGYSSSHGGDRLGRIGGYGASGGRNNYDSHDSSDKNDSHDQKSSYGGLLGGVLGGNSNGHQDSSKKQDENITDKVIQVVADYAKKKWLTPRDPGVCPLPGGGRSELPKEG